MRVHATLFVTTLLIASAAAAGPTQLAANQRPASAMKTVDLSQVANPTDTLDQAKVQDARGFALGQVQRVVTSETGTVARVEVALKAPQKVVSLSVNQLRYVPFNGQLQTTLTSDQVGALPSVGGKAQ